MYIASTGTKKHFIENCNDSSDEHKDSNNDQLSVSRNARLRNSTPR